ncbi:hypothetical protein [Sphaerisporangium sp. NPDC051011]|uniref:hypothetical protein n=1 Tax=Sphaerisporangium sp. NPDC051011 TaxID=3155792 RepID=UPI0033CE5A1B
MASTVVEIHVPLRETPGLAATDYPFPWIDEIEEFLYDLELQGQIKVFDDGEQDGEVYVFFIAGADEETLLLAASLAVTRDRVPADAFAMITDDEAPEFGLGHRIDLPWAWSRV